MGIIIAIISNSIGNYMHYEKIWKVIYVDYYSKRNCRKQKIRPNEKIVVNMERKADLHDIFGTWKTKTSAQKLKNIAKEGWQ